MALDTTQTHPAYLCGRLLATLDALEVAVVPQIEHRRIFYTIFPQAGVQPALAITATRYLPGWLVSLGRRDPAAAAAHQARIAELIAQIPPGPIPGDQTHQQWVTLGYHHQLAADVAGGWRPDLADEDEITTRQVAQLLGYQGDDAHRSAARWLHRAGIQPTGREPGRAGQNLYNRGRVDSAIAAMPSKQSDR